MRKIARIAVTEFLSTVRTKGFILSVVFTPVFILGSMGIQTFLKERVDRNDRRFAVVDPDGRLFPALERKAAERKVLPRFVPERHAPLPGEDPRVALSERVRAGSLFGFIVLPARLEGPEARVDYHTRTPTYPELPRWIADVVNEELRRRKLQAAGMPESSFRDLARFTPVRTLGLAALNERGEVVEAKGVNLAVTFGVPAGAMFLLFVLVMMSVPMLLHGVLEEKQHRIWEVLVSSVTPFELLLGKLLGAVMISMALSAFYLGGAALLVSRLGISDSVPGSLYAWFVVYQLLALLIYGSIFSAIGAACSELRDAQNLVMPAMLVIVIPMFGWFAVLRAPESAFSRGISLFPPATPMLMLLRIATDPGPAVWEIALSIVLTSAFSLACVWAAGKVFRVGILAQGQTPSLKRLATWVFSS